ncbi:MAG: hypothetical protein ACO2PO_22915 [Candidatus Calescibacterium sp.]|jgi:hypothetical protein
MVWSIFQYVVEFFLPEFLGCPYCSVSSGTRDLDFWQSFLYGSGILLIFLVFSGILVGLVFINISKREK